MLVLNRQLDESIMIGDDIEITIVDIRGDKVRLGITAPKHIPVQKREKYKDQTKNNTEYIATGRETSDTKDYHLDMILISRQRDESIMIGDNVEVIIIDIRGEKVRLGITVPKDIPVHRREIYNAIRHEKNGSHVSKEDRLLIRLYIKEKVDPEKIANKILELRKALNRYHISSDGNGLIIDDWQQFINSDVMSEVLS